MRQLGIQGVVCGKAQKTTRQDKALPCPRDKVNRQFRAPPRTRSGVFDVGAIGSSPMDDDFTCVSTWQGFVHVAFVIDTFANRIVGWRASRSPQTQFVLDALEQVLYERRPVGDLVHRSDRGSQYV